MDPNRNPTSPIHPQTTVPPPRGYALSGKIMLSAIVVLFTVVLFILFLHLYIRWHVYRRESRRRTHTRRSRLIFTAGGDQIAPSQIPRGLDPVVINSLSVLVFSSKDSSSPDDVAVECAVCLSEFEEGEKFRVLPRCGHRFHIGCIDMWFSSHNSCPLCRSPVEVESPPVINEESPSTDFETPAVAPPHQYSDADLCFVSSSNSGSGPESWEVSIEISRREEELGLGSTSGQKNRIRGFKRFLSRDLRLVRGVEEDLERGEGSPPPPAPPSVAE